MSNQKEEVKSRKTLEQLRVISTKITRKELVFYCRTHARALMASHVLKLEQSDSITSLVKNILDDCDSRQLKVLLLMAEHEQVDTQVSTFNACKVLSENGFKIEYSSSVKHDVHQTLSTGYDGSEFPKDHKKFIAVSKGAEVAYAPIRNSLVDTNYLKFAGFKFVTFHLEFAMITGMLTTFFEMKNGRIVSIGASEAGEQLLNFKHYLGSKFQATLPVAIDYIGDAVKLCQSPDPRGWSNTSLSGPSFSHYVYLGLAKVFSKDPTTIDYLLLICDGLFGSQVIRGHSTPVVALANRKLVVTHKSISVPMSLNSVTMKLAQKEANLDQAYLAVGYSRGFRGTNAGEKGAGSRMAYFVCNASPELAELSYMVTNLGRFIDKMDNIILYINSYTHGNVAKTILDALVALNFKGEIFIPKITHIIATMKPVVAKCDDGEHEVFQRDYYEYARAAFKVFVMHEDMASYCSRGSWHYKEVGAVVPPKNTVVLDWRPLELNLADKKKIMLSEDVVERDLMTRISLWSQFTYPVISRASLFRNLVHKPLSCVTGVELHDLVSWVGYNIELTAKPTDWWYNVTGDTIPEICAASILCNFSRSIRFITGVSPFALLGHLKFKVPVVSVVGLGKPQIGVTQYSVINAALAEVERGGDINEFYNQQAPSMRAAMMTNEVIVSAMVDPNSVKLVDEGTSSGGGGLDLVFNLDDAPVNEGD